MLGKCNYEIEHCRLEFPSQEDFAICSSLEDHLHDQLLDVGICQYARIALCISSSCTKAIKLMIYLQCMSQIVTTCQESGCPAARMQKAAGSAYLVS